MRLFGDDGQPLMPGDPARMPREFLLLADGRVIAWMRDHADSEYPSLETLCHEHGLNAERVRVLADRSRGGRIPWIKGGGDG